MVSTSARNGQLLEQIEVADENHLAANIKAIKSFSESQKKIPVRMMLVPDAANVLNHSLPALGKAGGSDADVQHGAKGSWR